MRTDKDVSRLQRHYAFEANISFLRDRDLVNTENENDITRKFANTFIHYDSIQWQLFLINENCYYYDLHEKCRPCQHTLHCKKRNTERTNLYFPSLKLYYPFVSQSQTSKATNMFYPT